MAIRGTNRQEEIQINRRKKDTRRMGQKFTDAMNSTDSIMFLLLIFAFAGIAFTLFLGVPGSLEILVVILFFINRSQFNFKKKAFEFYVQASTNEYAVIYVKQKETPFSSTDKVYNRQFMHKINDTIKLSDKYVPV